MSSSPVPLPNPPNPGSGTAGAVNTSQPGREGGWEKGDNSETRDKSEIGAEAGPEREEGAAGMTTSTMRDSKIGTSFLCEVLYFYERLVIVCRSTLPT